MSRRELLMFLFRRKWALFGTATLVVLLVTALVYLLPPIYVGTAKVVVERNRAPTMREEIVPGLEMVEVMNTETAIATSRLVLAAAVDEAAPHELRIPRDTALRRALNRLLDDMAAMGLITRMPPREKWIDALSRRVRAEPLANSNVIEITFPDEEPEWAARLVNAVTEQYIAKRFEVYAQDRETAYLRAQLAAAEDVLAERRAALARLLGEGGSAGIDTRITSLTDQLANLYGDRAERRASVEEMRVRFLPQNAELRREEEHLSSLEAEITDLSNEIGRLEKISIQEDRLSELVADAAARVTQLREMLRDAELGSAGEQAFVNAHVVDYASLPVKPKFQRLLLIILAVPGGLILGFCIAFLREYLDGRVKDEAEAETALGVPGFGSVPAMGWLQSLRANP